MARAQEKGLVWIASFASLALAEIYLRDRLKELMLSGGGRTAGACLAILVPRDTFTWASVP